MFTPTHERLLRRTEKHKMDDKAGIQLFKIIIKPNGRSSERRFLKFSLRFLSGVWGRISPTSGKKTDEKNYERIVNRHNLKMRFLQKWIPTRPACKDSER